MPDNMHLLPEVGRARLSRVDLIFVGDKRVDSILDTGAHRSLLNTSGWKRICTMMPPLLQPSNEARRMIGASGAPLTVRKCPIVLNGYQYYVNLKHN